jgi:hypothetical protein
MNGKIESGLTRLYAKLSRGGVTDTSEHSAGGISRTVYWFHEDSKRMGDYSPLGTLLLNEQAKEDFSEDVVDYAFLHEVGHDQMRFIVRTLFWAIYLTSGLSFIGAVISLPRTLIIAVEYSPSLTWLPIYIAMMLGLTFAVGLPFVVISWIDETLAELFAISKLGIERYESVLEEIKSESEASLMRKIRFYIRYPPDPLILWIARKRGVGQE